jgi:hypothetical protein
VACFGTVQRVNSRFDSQQQNCNLLGTTVGQFCTDGGYSSCKLLLSMTLVQPDVTIESEETNMWLNASG